MLRRIFLGTISLILVFMLGMGVFVQPCYALPADARILFDDQPYFELTKDYGSKTFDKEIIISGKAKEGSVITLAVYNYKTVVGTSPAQLKKPEAAKYQWVLSPDNKVQDFSVGASGIFARKVKLEMGKNKLEIKVKDKAGEIAGKVLEIEVVNKEAVTNMVFDMVMKNIDKSIKE